MSDSALVLASQKTKLFAALQEYAAVLSNLENEQVPAAFEMTDQLKELAEEVRTRLRDRLLLIVSAVGTKVTEKGSMAADLGNFLVKAIPTRTGVDPKKLEGLLRKRQIELTRIMDATVTYKVNEHKLLDAQVTKLLTQADVDSCRYDKAFRVTVEPTAVVEGSS